MRSNAPRSLYAVNESSGDRGSISVYDIDAGHRLIKTIQTVPGVGDVRGVAVSAVTGKLFVAYRDVSGTGMVYCLDVYSDSVLWNRAIPPGVDRLAIHPNGKLLIVTLLHGSAGRTPGARVAWRTILPSESGSSRWLVRITAGP